ncbi:D-amino-acid dehydrogenase [Natronocella acetinitrilica]|uniref:D-amino-acid dehydrogenase n=1 Tax=Natronocella acetinitrilica TaxID=414046 RepID=A0AAE3G3C7_9GAMM|nr:D-amino acid dehydrogenase [Natronocella acetinitrilica]MCP1674904.1 D-amino-acid dehydrogenase [Natronocella acetinitrilica]
MSTVSIARKNADKPDAVVLGAGIIGVATAYWLARSGLQVTVVDRRPGPALETSYGNGGQISVSHAEPWANPSAPGKVLTWLFDAGAPLLYRPKMDPAQWSWLARWMLECLPSRSRANTRRIVEIATFSREMLQAIREREGIRYDERTQGILHFYRDRKEFESAIPVAEMMREMGCDREVVDREAILRLEPAFAAHGQDIIGGTYTRSDESGDIHLFTRGLADVCERMGVRFLFNQDIESLETAGGSVRAVHLRDRADGDRPSRIEARTVVAAMGSYAAPFLKRYGVRLPIYPAKGYSMTIPVGPEHDAPTVSLTDDQYKLVYSRLGDRLRVAGSAELVGYDTGINQTRCNAIFENVRNLFPNAGDYEQVQFWTGLRPATPSNVPILERRGFDNLYLNLGHGTLGWTMGCGSGYVVARQVASDLGAPQIEAFDVGAERAQALRLAA